MSELSEQAIALLLDLRNGGAFKGSSKPAWSSGAPDWKEKRASAEVLIERGFARRIRNEEAPGIIHLELTSEGVGKSSMLSAERSVLGRLRQLNWLGWLTLFAATASAYFAYTGPNQ